jgi:hypothetical protein
MQPSGCHALYLIITLMGSEGLATLRKQNGRLEQPASNVGNPLNVEFSGVVRLLSSPVNGAVSSKLFGVLDAAMVVFYEK